MIAHGVSLSAVVVFLGAAATRAPAARPATPPQADSVVVTIEPARAGQFVDRRAGPATVQVVAEGGRMRAVDGRFGADREAPAGTLVLRFPARVKLGPEVRALRVTSTPSYPVTVDLPGAARVPGWDLVFRREGARWTQVATVRPLQPGS